MSDGDKEIEAHDGSTITVGEELDSDGVLYLGFEDDDDTFDLFISKDEWDKIKAAIDAVFNTGSA